MHFSGVEGLRKIIIPSSVIEIEDTAFSNNKTLETVVIQRKPNFDRKSCI